MFPQRWLASTGLIRDIPVKRRFTLTAATFYRDYEFPTGNRRTVDHVSVSSAAYRNPALIPELIAELGPERVTLAIDVDHNPALPSGYEVYIDGGRTATGTDALAYARQAADIGVNFITYQ